MLDISIKFDDANVRKMMRLFPAEMSAAVNKGLQVSGDLVARTAKANLSASGAAKFRTLQRSIAPLLDKNAHVVRIGPLLEAKATGSEESPKNYGYFVEHGRAAGKPPPWKVLVLYAKRHGTGDNEDPEKAAFLMARSIGARGTKAKPFLVPALEKNEGKIRLLMDKALSDAVRRLEQ